MPMRETPGLGLNAFWDLGADGWNTGMDTNLRLLSAVVGARVQSRTSALPGSPSAGSIYIVPVGDATNGSKLAVWDGPTGAKQWVYITPQSGWHFYVVDEGINVQWTGTSWVEFAAGGGGGGTSISGSQILIQLAQTTGQVIDTTTETLAFGNIVSDDNEYFNAADNTIRIPESQEGRTAVFVAHTKHTADGAGAIETTLERSEDAGVTWVPVASSADEEDYFGTTTLTALVTFIGGDWYRLRHTTSATKTTSGDAQTSLAVTTVGAGQVGRIVRTTSNRVVPNHIFQSGDFGEWTNFTASGTLKVYIPPDREADHVLHPDGYAYMGLQGSIGGPWYIEQVIDLPTDPSSITVYWDQHTRLVDDLMRLELDFLDASDQIIGQYVGGGRLNSAIQLWETFADTAANIPTGTTKVMLRLNTIVTGGPQQINVTNVRVVTTTLGVSGMLPGSIYAYLPSIATNQNKVLRVNSTGDDVEWGGSPIRFRAGSLDEPEVMDLQFLGTAFNAVKTGDTIQLSFTGGLALHGAAGEVSGAVTKLTITGAGAGITSPVPGEIEITIPGPGETAPPATTIEEVEGINAVRSAMSSDQNGQPLVWDQGANAFIPLPANFSPIAYGGGADILWAGDLAGVRNVVLTDDTHNLYQYDELHFVLRNANDHADVAVSADGGSTWSTVFWAWSGVGGTGEGTTSTDAFRLGGYTSDINLQIGTAVLRFFSEAGFPTMYHGMGSGPGASQDIALVGYSSAAEKHNAVIVQRDSSGNFTGGQLYIIGVKKTRQPVDLSARVQNGGPLSADQEILFHETMGLRFDQGSTVGRVRVSPAAAGPSVFQFQSDDGTELWTATVAAGETQVEFALPSSVVVNDALRVLAPATPDANITDVFLSLRGEAAR